MTALSATITAYITVATLLWGYAIILLLKTRALRRQTRTDR